MPRNILTEQVITLKAAAPLVPGGGVTQTTIFRWCTRGVLGPDGETRIILDSICFGGGQRFTSHQALTRFLEACDPAKRSSKKNVVA